MVLAFLAGGMGIDREGLLLAHEPPKSCEERVTGIRGLPASPTILLSIFTITCVSSLDSSLCGTEVGPHPSRNTVSLVPSLHLGPRFSFSE